MLEVKCGSLMALPGANSLGRTGACHGATMKTTQITTKTRMDAGNKARRGASLRLRTRNVLFTPARTDQNLIQWPTGPEINDVSKRLARVKQEAIRCEAGGDYFKSGDLAYQIQEIIRSTADLFNKSRRAKE